MLSPKEFNALSLEQKSELICKIGRLTSRVRSDSLHLAWYKVDNFYVELLFDGATKKVLSITGLPHRLLLPKPTPYGHLCLPLPDEYYLSFFGKSGGGFEPKLYYN